MGKKSRAKQQRQKAAQQAAKHVAPNPIVTPLSATPLGTKLASGTSPKAVAADYTYVRTDIRRILFLLLIVVVLLITTVIVNSRSTGLRTLGSKIAHFMQLQ